MSKGMGVRQRCPDQSCLGTTWGTRHRQQDLWLSCPGGGGQASLEGYRMLMCVHTCVREKICMYISTYIHSSHNDPVR